MSNRLIHFRVQRPWSTEELLVLGAGARIWNAYVQAVLAEETSRMGNAEYDVGAVRISSDPCVATLSITGAQTLASRAAFEDAACYMIWQFLPLDRVLELETGLEEDIGSGYQISWRRAVRREKATTSPFEPSR